MKKALVLLLPLTLMISTVSCAGKSRNSEPVMQTEAETTNTTTSENIPQTEPTTENATKPTVEYYDGLICSDKMTDKEKERSSFREYTMLDSAKCFSLSKNGRNFYPLPDSTELKVKKFTDDIREIKIYDEQLDTDFLVHVILPPDYDENKKYPVFLMTDPAYWFKLIPDLRQLISDGEAAPLIFVTLGYDYDRNGGGDEERLDKFIIRQNKFLDFITDDLMRTVALNYKIDESRSVFFGHSCGGTFSHYALCNSDKYEYQPFARYIMGSMAFWNYYHSFDEKFYDPSVITDSYAYTREFDYFDRNEAMDKNVFICAGGRENPSFEDNYNGNKNMTEEATALYERLISHGTDAELKIYEDCYHNNYVEDMLKDYLKQNFPPNDIT
jgi:predicted alpha/beta superfamily hydrolase